MFVTPCSDIEAGNCPQEGLLPRATLKSTNCTGQGLLIVRRVLSAWKSHHIVKGQRKESWFIIIVPFSCLTETRTSESHMQARATLSFSNTVALHMFVLPSARRPDRARRREGSRKIGSWRRLSEISAEHHINMA